MSSTAAIPYCGAPPIPGHLAWNTDPVLALCLAAIAASYVLGTRSERVPPRPQLCFWAGYAVLVLALISPLCNLSVALFSARVAQHVILTTIAAPLIVLGRPECIVSAFPPSVRAWFRSLGRGNAGLAGAVVLFGVAMWVWHLPAAYDATFRSTPVYWTMHATMTGSALIFWTATLRGRWSFSSTLFALFATILQMSLLGALLTFAPRPLFAVHAATTWAWRLTPLQDQQLGGLFLWVIGGTLLTLYALALFTQSVLRADDQIVDVRGSA